MDRIEPVVVVTLGAPTLEASPAHVALYSRVSSDAQTVDYQLVELRAYAATRQWTVTGEYRDEGVSGSKDRRPALDRLIA